MIKRTRKGKPDKPPGKPDKPGQAYTLLAEGWAFNLWMARVTGPDAPQPPIEAQGYALSAGPGAFRATIALGNWDDVLP